ncbi:MAG: dihydropteroate synthase [Candidatus Omnitrophota bacterium]
MGVLNVTPDSFSDGGKYFTKQAAIEHALRMAEEGADIIDIGAESTRPQAQAVKPNEQLKRIDGIVRILCKKLPIPVSIDTSSAAVARRCLDLGASIINDISALSNDPGLAQLIAQYKAGVVLMHIRGTPRTMQNRPRYRNLIKEIIGFLRIAKERALKNGIEEKRIVVDPGIGFGKTTKHNLEIIKALSDLKTLNRPILIGPSRKSFIGNLLGVSPKEREFGTAAAVVYSVINGANILRVHVVKQMRQAVLIAEAIKKTKNTGLIYGMDDR